jgi:hypothetical protein
VTTLVAARKLRENQPMLWTGPRRVDSLFFVQRRLARRVTRQRLSSVLRPPAVRKKLFATDGAQIFTDVFRFLFYLCASVPHLWLNSSADWHRSRREGQATVETARLDGDVAR